MNVALAPQQRRKCLTALLLVVLLSVTSCSSVNLVYRQLDWLIPWYLDDYISLDNKQQNWLQQRLDEQLQWHRYQQLPRYAQLLRTARTELADGLSDGEYQRLQQQLRGAWDELIEQLLPHLVTLLSGLSDEQVEELFTNIEQNGNADYRADYLQGPIEERRRRRVQQSEQRLERWLGSVGNAQRRVLQRSARRYIDNAKLALNYRQRWQQRLRLALQDRRARADKTALTDELRGLLTAPELWLALPDELRRFQTTRRANYRRLLKDIDTHMTPTQRAFLLEQLSALAGDFDTLAKR